MLSRATRRVRFSLLRQMIGHRGEHLAKRHWARFFEEARLGVATSLRRVQRMAKTVLQETEAARHEVEAMPGVSPAILPTCEAAIRTRASAILAGLEDERPAGDTAIIDGGGIEVPRDPPVHREAN